MKYTTIEQLSEKLRGRLSLISGTTSNTPYPVTTVTTPVSPLLIEDVAREKEAFVDIILSTLYVLPLRHSHIIVTEIVEALIITDLVSYSYWDNTASMPTDVTQGLKNHAYMLLGMLTAGLNFNIPGVMPQQISPGMMPPKRIELKDEIPVSTAQTRVLVNNDTIVKQSVVSQQVSEFYLGSRFNRGVPLGSNADYWHSYNPLLTDPNMRVIGGEENSLD